MIQALRLLLELVGLFCLVSVAGIVVWALVDEWERDPGDD